MSVCPNRRRGNHVLHGAYVRAVGRSTIKPAKQRFELFRRNGVAVTVGALRNTMKNERHPSASACFRPSDRGRDVGKAVPGANALDSSCGPAVRWWGALEHGNHTFAGGHADRP